MKPHFETEKTRLYLGNNLQVLASLAEGGFEADAVVTDPPFWKQRLYDVEPTAWPEMEIRLLPCLDPESWVLISVDPVTCELGQEEHHYFYAAHLVYTMRKVKACLAPGGTMWVVLRDTYTSAKKGNSKQKGQNRDLIVRKDWEKKCPPRWKRKCLLCIPELFALAMMQDGWYFRQRVTIANTRPSHDWVKDRPYTSHLDLLLFANNERYAFFPERDKRAAHKSVWHTGWFANEGRSPSATSPNVVRRAMRLSVKPPGVVLDPFGGTGTTAVVAEGEGLSAVLIEASPEIAKSAVKRLQQGSLGIGGLINESEA